MKTAMHRNIRSGLLSSLLLALAIGAGACGGDDLSDDAFGQIDLVPYFGDGATASNPGLAFPLAIEAKKAFGNGGDIEYYDFGLVTNTRVAGALVVTVNPMYFFFDNRGNPLLAQPQKDERFGHWTITGGNPTYSPVADRGVKGYQDLPYSVRQKKLIKDPRRGGSTAHQRPIIDQLHGDKSYSGTWEIVEVTAPSGYEPDSIKSWRTLSKGIDKNDFKVKYTGAVISCPVMDERQTLMPTLSNYQEARPRMDIWYRRKMGSCFMSHGWESLADVSSMKQDNPDPTKPPLTVSETGVALLLKAGAERAKLIPTITVNPNVKGEVKLRTLFVPVGKFYTPLVESKRNDITYQLRDMGQMIADFNPATFSPVLQQFDFKVPEAPLYKGGTFKTAADLDPTIVSERSGPIVRNVVVIGSPTAAPECAGWIDDPKDMNKPPKRICDSATAKAGYRDDQVCAAYGLVCNPQTCRCDIPPSSYGEYCAPNVRRCRGTLEMSDDEKAWAPLGFACHAKKPRGNCYIACDGNAADLTDEKVNGLEVDSRCGYVPGYTCVTPKDLDKAKDSICIRGCNTTDKPDDLKLKCNTPHVVTKEDGTDVDIAKPLQCQTFGNVTGCALIETLEPR